MSAGGLVALSAIFALVAFAGAYALGVGGRGGGTKK
jgi:hypothetical protein